MGGLDLTPRFRQLAIDYRRDEIDLDQTRGRNSFRVDLEFTYGRERQDERFARVFGQPSNTYTADVNAYLPIWDWGERDARIRASEISLRQTELDIEETTSEVVSDVVNEVRNVAEFQERALSMEENLDLATELSASSLDLYETGGATILDVLQSFRREVDTANDLLRRLPREATRAAAGPAAHLLRLRAGTFRCSTGTASRPTTRAPERTGGPPPDTRVMTLGRSCVMLGVRRSGGLVTPA